VACAEMADKNKVCIVCSVCVHPVLPCSHTSTKKDLVCDKCFQALPTTDKPKHPAQETKLKDSPIPDDKPVKTPDLESVKEDIKVDDKAPEELLVSKIKIKYPQHELDQCFIRGVASSLYYCGLTQASWRLCNTAHKFEWLTKTFPLKELKNVMQ
jgi:hypothetical protein